MTDPIRYDSHGRRAFVGEFADAVIRAQGHTRCCYCDALPYQAHGEHFIHD